MDGMERIPLNTTATRFGRLPESIFIPIREPGSAFTHAIALMLTLIGAGPLLLKARICGSSATEASMGVFLISACLLYAASTAYHSVVGNKKMTERLRRIDHMSISILIAGTYTPICLTALKGRIGYALLAAIWILAVIGIIFKAVWYTCPRWISSLLYLVMGWLCMAALPAILHALPLGAFIWLLLGGVLYTAGAVIYALKLSRFNARHLYFGSHEIFHCFIMAGTLCHYVVMFGYVSMIG